MLGNESTTVKLFAENFFWGNLTFNYGTMEDERIGWINSASDLSKIFLEWLKNESKNPPPENHKQETHKLYRLLFSARIKGRIIGVLNDIDLKNENLKLKDENIKLKLQNEEYKKDTITALKELRDKNSLIEEYEKTLGIRKP